MYSIPQYFGSVTAVFVLIVAVRQVVEKWLPFLKKVKGLPFLFSALCIVASMQFAIVPALQSLFPIHDQVPSHSLIPMKNTENPITKVVLAHAYPADAQTAWYPHFKAEMEKAGIEVVIPALPNPETSTAEQWVSILEKEANKQPESTLLVGHSIGGTALLRMLEKSEKQFAGLVMVSTAGFDLGYPALKDFFAEEFDFASISERTGFITTYYSLNDQVLAPDPMKHAQVFLEQLDAKTIVLHNRGHFAPFDDCTSHPELVAEVLSLK